MLDFICANKEWIFSGIGVTAVSLIGWLLQRFTRKSKQATFLNDTETGFRQPSVGSMPLNQSETAGITKRFRRILDLMNGERGNSSYTIARLAEIMRLNSVGELESIFLGRREPSFQFIDQFCETFGINKRWLIEGKGAPFSTSDTQIYDPLDCLSEIQRLLPQKVYFIRSSSEVGEVFVCLKITDWHFKILPSIWHISEHVGGGGRSQIFSLYKLILTLQEKYSGNLCGGRILPNEKFRALSSGNVFPGAELPFHENHWWDDFVDIHHKYSNSPNYEANYGKGFIEAQAIVRQKLQEEIAHK